MKKVLAVILSIMMIFASVAVVSNAAVAKDDTSIDYLLSDDFAHLDYLAKKDNFTKELRTYTALGLYENAWDNLFTGSVDVSSAEAILLALIEKVDAQYENETFEKVIKYLEGANTVAGIINKVDSYTGLIGLAENSTWASSISALNTIIKVANYGNNMYETFIEGYAAILSAQAASAYYGEFLDYLAANTTNSAVKTAAQNIKVNINQSYEEAVEELLAELAAQAAKDGASYGIQIAMDAWTVTTAIKTAYNTVSNIAKKVFNTSDKYKYMSSLVILKDIENVAPAYVKDVLDADDADASAFALHVIITIRETGENMLGNLGKVVEDSYVNKLLTNVSYKEVKEGAAKGEAILSVIRTLISSDAIYTTYAPQAFISTQSDVTVYNAEGEVIASIAANKLSNTIDENGAFVAVYSSTIAGAVTVVVPFVEGVTAQAEEATAPSSGSSSSGKSSGNFFQRLIEAIKAMFANIFKFNKK